MSKDRMLYKYLPVDGSFDSPDTLGSLSVIRDGTLKYTSPVDFNDPFDCQPDYDFEAIFNSIPQNFPNDPLEEFQGANPEKHWNEEWLHKQYIPAFGVCCFSRCPTSILMWSHYASHHKGIVAEFHSTSLFHYDNQDISLNLAASPVIYKKKKPLISRIDSKFEKKCLLTKSNNWCYEKESRVILNPDQISPPINKHGIHPYHRDLLKSVIIGLKCETKHIDLITQEVASINESFGLSIVLKHVTRSNGKFAIKICDC